MSGRRHRRSGRTAHDQACRHHRTAATSVRGADVETVNKHRPQSYPAREKESGGTHMERLLNLAVVLYLVAHGVFVPRGGQADLVTGFCHATRAWFAAIIAGIGA